MKPVTVSVDVPQSRDEVFAFLDVMANHESFNDHMLRDGELSGPDRGVGSKARVHAKAGGRTDVIEFETVEAQAPVRIVEHNIGAKGRRHGTGTYLLEERPGGGTRIAFEYAWRSAPASERMLAPLVRAVMRRGLRIAMKRLAEQLAQPSGATASVGAGPSPAARPHGSTAAS